MPRGRSKKRLRSARTMGTRVRTSATCTCNRAVSIRPKTRCDARSRLMLTCHRRTTLWALRRLREATRLQAEKYFRAALRVQPDLAEAQNNLATLLAGRRAYREAAYHFEKAIRSAPAYVEARHGYGLVLALMQSYTRAVAELETAVRLAPDRAPARVDLADVLATLGRLDEARREYTAAIRLDPANREARAGLAALGRKGG